MANRYTEDFKKQIIAQYQTDISAAKLCSQYGITRSTLFLWKKQYTADETGQIPRERRIHHVVEYTAEGCNAEPVPVQEALSGFTEINDDEGLPF